MSCATVVCIVAEHFFPGTKHPAVVMSCDKLLELSLSNALALMTQSVTADILKMVKLPCPLIHVNVYCMYISYIHKQISESAASKAFDSTVKQLLIAVSWCQGAATAQGLTASPPATEAWHGS